VRKRKAKHENTPPVPIAERRHPTQARAKATVDTILEGAAALLEEVGFDSFNTNVLAERAGVRVRSVYRYFPNKFAVMAALWKKMLGEWDDLLANTLADVADPATDLRASFGAMTTAYVHWLTHRPGAWAIRSTIRAMPELAAQERSAEEWFVRQVAGALHKRGVGLPLARLKIVCTVVFRSATALMHTDIVDHGRPRKVMIDEMKQLANLYFEHNLGKNVWK
jgi:AcrR family transcriptional regulator